jgi:uncharacterized protein (DUF3084 family)
MPKMNIADAAEYFGVSKEAIHNRIRRGSLSSFIEDGVKLVNVDKTNVGATKVQIRKSSFANDDRYYKLLEEQNIKLQDKVEKLEDETRSLREQKEQMLIQERIKIEQIYKDKDEQLKNILGTLSSQFMLNTPELKVESEHFEAEIEEIQEVQEVEHVKFSKLVSLKKYLKRNKYSSKKHDKIKKRFKKIALKDERVIIIDKKYYLNLDKYDYSDIF